MFARKGKFEAGEIKSYKPAVNLYKLYTDKSADVKVLISQYKCEPMITTNLNEIIGADDRSQQVWELETTPSATAAE